MATDVLAAGRHRKKRETVPFGKEKATSGLSINTICKKEQKEDNAAKEKSTRTQKVRSAAC